MSDYLKMDYTSGLGDGTQLSTNYAMTVKNDRFNDQFTSLDTVICGILELVMLL